LHDLDPGPILIPGAVAKIDKSVIASASQALHLGDTGALVQKYVVNLVLAHVDPWIAGWVQALKGRLGALVGGV
jgi:hypothetical protein